MYTTLHFLTLIIVWVTCIVVIVSVVVICCCVVSMCVIVYVVMVGGVVVVVAYLSGFGVYCGVEGVLLLWILFLVKSMSHVNTDGLEMNEE